MGPHRTTEPGSERSSLAMDPSRECLPPSHFLHVEGFCSVFRGTRGRRGKLRQGSRRTCLPSTLAVLPRRLAPGAHLAALPSRAQSQVAAARWGRGQGSPSSTAVLALPGRSRAQAATRQRTSPRPLPGRTQAAGSLQATEARAPAARAALVGFPAPQPRSARLCSYLVPLGELASPQRARPGPGRLAWGERGGREPMPVSPPGHPVLAFLDFMEWWALSSSSRPAGRRGTAT